MQQDTAYRLPDAFREAAKVSECPARHAKWADLSLLLGSCSSSLALVSLQGPDMQACHLPQLLLQLLALGSGTAAGLLGSGELPVLLPAADCHLGRMLLLPLHLLPACA